MEYTICRYCGKPFFGKNKLQRYHKKCRKIALKENIKRYHTKEEVKDRNNYNSLIRRLNKKENEYKTKIEAKYVSSLISLKLVSSNFNVEEIKEYERKGWYIESFKKRILEVLKIKESIEEASILSETKLRFLNDLSIPELKKKIEKKGSDYRDYL